MTFRVEVGQKVRVYGADTEWFYEGEVVRVDGDHAIVDYADWTTRYRSSLLLPRHDIFCAEFLLPSGPGEIIGDYRLKTEEPLSTY